MEGIWKCILSSKLWIISEQGTQNRGHMYLRTVHLEDVMLAKACSVKRLRLWKEWQKSVESWKRAGFMQRRKNAGKEGYGD